MKLHRGMTDSEAAAAELGLYRAVLTLRDEDECKRFFADLCTPAELEALVDRWAVAAYLKDGLAYRKIHALTGVSVTTIGRVARFLASGSGGYSIALERLDSSG